MFKVGDLVQIKESSLKAHRLFCEPDAVFTILGVEKSSYKINAKIVKSHIIKCDNVGTRLLVGAGTIVPYIEPRENIECML